MRIRSAFQRPHLVRFTVAIAAINLLASGGFAAEEQSTATKIQVVDGIVMPRRPVREAIADAMQFLRKADGDYVPGKIDGDLAGYFSCCHVNADGTRPDKTLVYPARQHAYFITTFLEYQRYSGNKEWLLRARDLGDWNLAHSTPPNAVYANLPYSAMLRGKPGGGKDGNAIEPDKAAFLGSSYLELYEATKDAKYLNGAKAIAVILAKKQNKDGSWPFRVVPEDGTVNQEFGGAPVFFVQFFEDIQRYDKKPEYRTAHDRALQLMLDRNIEKNLWGTYHEDIGVKPDGYLSAEPMSFTAHYLLTHIKDNPKYVEMGRKVLERMEERLVHTEGHPAAPAPAVSEQAGFEHMMPGHTARYCLALSDLYRATHDEKLKKKTISGINALTYMQAENGLFRTIFVLVHEKNPNKKRLDWYSQHLYTICHLLQMMPDLPEAFPGSAAAK